jgi:hypothetical protein
MTKKLLLFLFGYLLACEVAAAQGFSAPSVWQNDKTSLLYIDIIAPNGQFAGRFHNRAPGYRCHDIFVAEGRIAKRRITFTVNFKNTRQDCRTVTTWAGGLSANTIFTNWNLIYTNPNGGIIRERGRDTFARQ